MKKISFFVSFIYALFFLQATNGQLGFCNGSSGDPIFTETFGTGTTNGPALPNGTTTYTYVNGTPNDGSYTISSRTNFFDWHDTTDRTPGDTNGRSFIVNADFVPGEFFRRTIDGLCENTSYEFSSWVLNLLPSFTACPNGGIPINVGFQIWDNTDTVLLASGDTGDIPGTSTPIWEQYALVFQTEPGQTSVILKMINNGAGGCGNDLAIDDIVFKSCGDNINLNTNDDDTSIAICEDEAPLQVTINANPDFSVFTSHAYQWQTSTDRTNWSDILGATNQGYTTPLLNNTTFYRVKVAEDAINLSNASCNVVSDIFDIIIENSPNAPTALADVILCADEMGGVQVSVPDGILVNWYDAATNGNLLLAENTFFSTQVTGTYYAEAVTQLAGCISNSRTPVSIIYNELPLLENQELSFCENANVVLSADFPNATYEWSTGEVSESISVDTPGDYTVLVTDNNGCSALKTVKVTQIDLPIIVAVRSDQRDVIIELENTGEFEYSLDGFSYQNSPVFTNLEGGMYTVFVRELNGCGINQLSFVHMVIPKFFTPNGDGINDEFKPEGISLVQQYQISIFDRYGKLITSSTNLDFSWDGRFQNINLPTSDYWYRIQLDEQTLRGSFTLKR